MKLLLLTLTILLISGCKEDPVPPPPCVLIFPELPTYKTPPSKHFTKPILLANGLYAVNGTELEDVFRTNAKLRRICSNYAIINKKVNKEYQ